MPSITSLDSDDELMSSLNSQLLTNLKVAGVFDNIDSSELDDYFKSDESPDADAKSSCSSPSSSLGSSPESSTITGLTAFIASNTNLQQAVTGHANIQKADDGLQGPVSKFDFTLDNSALALKEPLEITSMDPPGLQRPHANMGRFGFPRPSAFDFAGSHTHPSAHSSIPSMHHLNAFQMDRLENEIKNMELAQLAPQPFPFGNPCFKNSKPMHREVYSIYNNFGNSVGTDTVIPNMPVPQMNMRIQPVSGNVFGDDDYPTSRHLEYSVGKDRTVQPGVDSTDFFDGASGQVSEHLGQENDDSGKPKIVFSASGLLTSAQALDPSNYTLVTKNSCKDAACKHRALESINKFEKVSNFGNDYNSYYVQTGVFPQTHVQNVENPLVGYPRLQKLHELKAQLVLEKACDPYCSKMPVQAMSKQLTSWANIDNLKFDVVLVGGCYQYALSLEILLSLPVAELTPRPSLLFLWVPSHGLDAARKALEIWGFRRSEDITFMTRGSDSKFFPPQDPEDCVLKSSWHCLLGLKGTLRRSEDFDLINCNVDTDIVIETGLEQENIVPEQIYSIIENFSLMSRRIHIVPGSTSLSNGVVLPVKPRPGWVIISPDAPANNFAPFKYMSDMRQRGHTVSITDEIDLIRPKTPPRVKSKF